jgi:hypothetical protein
MSRLNERERLITCDETLVLIIKGRVGGVEQTMLVGGD